MFFSLTRQSHILVGLLGLQSSCLKRHKPNVCECAHKRLDVGEDIKQHTDMRDEHAVVVNTSLSLFQVFTFGGGGSDGTVSVLVRLLRLKDHGEVGVCKTGKCLYLCRCVELFIRNQSIYADLVSHVSLLIL